MGLASGRADAFRTPVPRAQERPPATSRCYRVLRSTAWVFLVYLGLSVLLNLHAWTAGPSDRAQAAGGDVAIFVWSLRWAAYALVHGHNLFYSNWVNYPGGVNLLNNTTVLLLGIIATPLTLAFGAVVSFNVLQTLAFALSALGARQLVRRWTSWSVAAFVGGLAYGFSSYSVSSGWSHLHAIFLALPPLILLCLDELLVRQKGSAIRWGVGLGVLASAQFFISSEVLADTFELCLVGVVLLAVLHRERIGEKLRYATTGVLTGAGVSLVLLAYPAWYAVFGPEHGSITAPAPLFSLYSSDLLGPIVPTSNQLLTTSGLSRLGDRYSGGLIRFPGGSFHLLTNATYVGLPLLLALLVIIVRYRRLAVVRFFAFMEAVAFVASLGPALKVSGHVTSVKLPERVLLHLPLLEATYPYRYGAFVALGAAIILAVGLDRLRPRSEYQLRPLRPRISRTVAAVILIGLALAPLVPAMPYSTEKISTPRYFTSGAVSAIAPGSVALTYPPPSPFTSITMVWQANAGLRFRMVGAYMFAQDGHGAFTLAPNHSPTEVLLYDIWAAKPVPAFTPALEGRIRQALADWRVGNVLIAMSEAHSETAVSLFSAVLGRPPQYEQGVAAWYRLPFASGRSAARLGARLRAGVPYGRTGLGRAACYRLAPWAARCTYGAHLLSVSDGKVPVCRRFAVGRPGLEPGSDGL